MKTIRQKHIFKKSKAKDLFDLLVSSKKHSAFTGEEAKATSKKGEKFSAYGGYIWGKNLEVIPGKKLVQEWNCADFPEGHSSEVTFEFRENKTGTTLEFTHKNVPAKNFKSISNGWKVHYWEPMEQFLKGS
jgi:activator of HSP90 ATPase